MKVWIEFPEDTRFARQPRDILYTPIYFANEKIQADIRLDKEWQTTHGDNLDQLFTARAKLIGKASLGFLSIGGRPVHGPDMRYAIPNLGFKPIYTLEILNVQRRVSLANLENDEVSDGVRGGKTAFNFVLPTSTLDDLQQLASSLKVITADNISTMGFLKGVTPALIVSVQYYLIAEILDENRQVVSTCREEIRIFTSLTEEQVPTSTHPTVTNNPMAKFVTTQVVSFNTTRSRRDSIPLIRRLSRTSSTQDTNLMTIDVESAEPFTFTKHSDAAASKVTISLLWSTDPTSNTNTSSEPPPPIMASIRWMLKSLTTLTLEPMERDLAENPDQGDDFFHLRTKILPSRKLKLNWSDWQRLPDTDVTRTRWKSTQVVWLVKDITSGMTPTFVTPYLTHTYVLGLSVSLAESEAKLGRNAKQRVELDVPIQVRYDLGLVPSYEVDQSLPEYDHTLPAYAEAGREDILDEADEEDDDAYDNAGALQQDLANLDLNLVSTTEASEDGTLPVRQTPSSSAQRSGDGQASTS